MTAERRPYLAAADLLRVFAVGLVAWFHIWQQSWLDPSFRVLGCWVDLQSVVRRGYMLVDLMLLLSGFLLYFPYATRLRQGRKPLDTAAFYKKRLWRILPSYLFAVGFAFVYSYIKGDAYGGTGYLWKDLLAHLTFTHTFSYRNYVWTSLNVALWTLAIEMQFYLLFPLVAGAFSRRTGLSFGMMTGIAIVFRFFVSRMADPTIWFNQLPGMLDLYAFGMLAAHILAQRQEEGRPWWNALGALLCLAGICQILFLQNPTDGRETQILQILWRLPLGALGAGFLLFGCRWPARLDALVGNRLTRFLAGISYNFYIWHQYLAVKLKEWRIPAYAADSLPQASEGHVWQQKYTACCFLAALAAAVLLTYLLEKPLTRLGQREKAPATHR